MLALKRVRWGAMEAVLAVFLLLATVGYARNVYALLQLDRHASIAEWAVRIVGIVVPPVGALGGWI